VTQVSLRLECLVLLISPPDCLLLFHNYESDNCNITSMNIQYFTVVEICELIE